MSYTGGPNATRLLRHFTALYPATSRPVLNDADSVPVTFDVSLVQIRELVSLLSICLRSLTFCDVACLWMNILSPLLLVFRPKYDNYRHYFNRASALCLIGPPKVRQGPYVMLLFFYATYTIISQTAACAKNNLDISCVSPLIIAEKKNGKFVLNFQLQSLLGRCGSSGNALIIAIISSS